KEEIPLDVLEAVKSAVESFIVVEASDGIIVGSVTGTASDTEITITGSKDYLDRYAVVKIDDGVNEETHQLIDNDSSIYQLNSNYNGGALLDSYAGADVKLQFPVYINPDYRDVRLPGVAIWGIDPTPILRGGRLDPIVDTWDVTNDNFKERIEGQILEFNILIDCEARQHELIDTMSRAVRKLIGGEILWINGRRHDIDYSGSPILQNPTAGIDIVSKIQYSLKVEVKEHMNVRVTVPKTTTINTTITIA
ncbi:unnamed protein product, partial [marine sediment metagenome]